MKIYFIFFICSIFLLIVDQSIKLIIQHYAVLSNPIYTTDFIDIVLVFNKGIAFSIGSSFGELLRWFILILLLLLVILFINSKDFFRRYYIYCGLIVGAGFSNLIDRFIYDGVVDYIFWHFGFKFAIFNLADATINVSLLLIIISQIKDNITAFKTNKTI